MKKYEFNKHQKQAVGLLSVGTFLEYFDLMLYVHMAVLLNELFFPATDHRTAQLLSALSFCATYLLRPFGALLFGYIGDRVGRKTVVVMTTFLMALSCMIMASSPSYAQIGITASWIMIICRMVQGMSATAEVRGAELYLTESSKPPIQYALVALITVFSCLGTTAALGVASLFTNKIIFSNIESSWRIAFFVGAGVALVGSMARTRLKEADEFMDKKRKLTNISVNNNMILDNNKEILDKKFSSWTAISYFFIQCARPPCFYFIYIYCGDILKQKFAFTPGEVINQNFFVSVVDLCGVIILVYLSYRIHPLRILQAKLALFSLSIIFFPIVLIYADVAHSTTYIFIFQCLASLFVFDHVPAAPIFYKYFPTFKRFTYTSVLSAFAKLLTYFITSFGIVYSTDSFGYFGMFFIFLPIGIAFFISVSYFQKLERNNAHS